MNTNWKHCQEIIFSVLFVGPGVLARNAKVPERDSYKTKQGVRESDKMKRSKRQRGRDTKKVTRKR